MKDFLQRLGFKRKTNIIIKSTTPTQMNQTVQRRMVIFGFLVVFSMSIIVARLFFLQILSSDVYQQKLDNYNRRYQTLSTPRGEIKDRNGNLIVTNKIIKSIIYYPPSFIKSEDEWELAQKFASNFNTDELVANMSDKTDLYLFMNKDEVVERFSEEEQQLVQSGALDSSEYNNLLKSKVTDADREFYNDHIVQSYKVYQAMRKSTSGGMKIIINNVESNEVAYLAEHNLEYPGFESYNNWERDYLDSYGLRGVIGSVSSEAQGLSSETIDFYLANDYSRDERMGLSGLENYYEELISGTKTIQDVVYSKEGFANPVEIQEGSKGNDLTLTVDLDLQKKAEQVVMDAITNEKGNKYRKYFNSGYVIVSDPRNGDILASVAVKEDGNGELYNNSSYNHLDAAIPGSTIKGATVYLGLSEGVVKPNEQVSDAGIKIAGTPLKQSYNKSLRSTNAVTALAQSSNVYMFHVAMRIADANYSYDQPLYGVDEKDFIKMKTNFSKFGLGSKTGLDVPNEGVGYNGKSFVSGFLLDFAMGQFDTYTPIQLATYVNTIANDGVRVKPRYLKNATDPMTGLTVFDNQTEVVSTLSDIDSLKVVQAGFRECVLTGLCRGSLNHDRYTVAAKTGTAEYTFKDTDGTIVSTAPHSLLVAYAPYEQPEVSITCVTPTSMNDIIQSNICQPIAGEILDYYFNNK